MVKLKGDIGSWVEETFSGIFIGGFANESDVTDN